MFILTDDDVFADDIQSLKDVFDVTVGDFNDATNELNGQVDVDDYMELFDDVEDYSELYDDYAAESEFLAVPTPHLSEQKIKFRQKRSTRTNWKKRLVNGETASPGFAGGQEKQLKRKLERKKAKWAALNNRRQARKELKMSRMFARGKVYKTLL